MKAVHNTSWLSISFLVYQQQSVHERVVVILMNHTEFQYILWLGSLLSYGNVHHRSQFRTSEDRKELYGC